MEQSGEHQNARQVEEHVEVYQGEGTDISENLGLIRAKTLNWHSATAPVDTTLASMKPSPLAGAFARMNAYRSMGFVCTQAAVDMSSGSGRIMAKTRNVALGTCWISC